jgi:starch synthase
MKILMAASEVEPYSKTGGLADVLGALPPALARDGHHQVGVVTPLYGSTELPEPELLFDNLSLTVGPDTHSVRVLTVNARGVRHYFLDYPPFFDREGVYGTPQGDYPDNAQRFLLFSKAVIEIARRDFLPDVVHCHDWQTGMVPALLKTAYAGDRLLAGLPVVLTIHNLGYQGNFDAALLAPLGLPPSLMTVDGIEFYGKISFLKAGLVYADALTTVSEAYAREIQTKEYGFGMDGLLRWRSNVLSGVLNGVDYSSWDPRTDRLIAATYSAENLAGKRVCKQDLLQTYGITAPAQRPLIGMVSRIAAQKGADVLSAAMQELMAMDVSMAMLGAGDAVYVDLFRSLEARFPGRFVLKVAYDEELAHKVEAGADLFLMPSRYEPCGLNQMYSLRYGTVPVVRATGGLDDTIEPFDPGTGEGNGFKFRESTPPALLAAVQEAFQVYANQTLWRKLMRNGMAQEFSWSRAVPKYERIYQRVLGPRAAPASMPGPAATPGDPSPA